MRIAPSVVVKSTYDNEMIAKGPKKRFAGFI